MLFKLHHIHGRKIFSVPILQLRKLRLRLISPPVTQVIRKEGQCHEARSAYLQSLGPFNYIMLVPNASLFLIFWECLLLRLSGQARCGQAFFELGRDLKKYWKFLILILLGVLLKALVCCMLCTQVMSNSVCPHGL